MKKRKGMGEHTNGIDVAWFFILSLTHGHLSLPYTHCLSLSPTVSHCLPLSPTVSHCLSLCTMEVSSPLAGSLFGVDVLHHPPPQLTLTVYSTLKEADLLASTTP